MSINPAIIAMKNTNDARLYRIGGKISRILKLIGTIGAIITVVGYIVLTIAVNIPQGNDFLYALSWENPFLWDILNVFYMSLAVTIPTFIIMAVGAAVAKIVFNNKEKMCRNIGYYLDSYIENNTHDEITKDIQMARKHGNIKQERHLQRVYEEITRILRYAPKPTNL
jgi:preprotein translocase subunit Sss1